MANYHLQVFSNLHVINIKMDGHIRDRLGFPSVKSNNSNTFNTNFFCRFQATKIRTCLRKERALQMGHTYKAVREMIAVDAPCKLLQGNERNSSWWKPLRMKVIRVCV